MSFLFFLSHNQSPTKNQTQTQISSKATKPIDPTTKQISSKANLSLQTPKSNKQNTTPPLNQKKKQTNPNHYACLLNRPKSPSKNMNITTIDWATKTQYEHVIRLLYSYRTCLIIFQKLLMLLCPTYARTSVHTSQFKIEDFHHFSIVSLGEKKNHCSFFKIYFN